MRVLAPKPAPPTFGQRVEGTARELTKRLKRNGADDAVHGTLVREMALTLDQIEGIHRVHHKMRRSLLRQECYLDTEIMQREPRPPVYQDPRLAERDRLRDRLRGVEKERRQLLLFEGEQLRPLHDRLLSLVNKHRHLQPPGAPVRDEPLEQL